MRDRADLLEAAGRAGMTVRQIETLPDGSIASRMTFEDPWAAAELLGDLTDQDSHDPVVRIWAYQILAATAEQLGEENAGPTLSPELLAAFIRALHFNVIHVIKFRHEPVETFQSARYTMELLAGDCDDHARLLVALARSAGVEAELLFLDDGEQPTHAVPLLRDRDSWWFAETTVDAQFGEPPLDALDRLRAAGVDLGRDPFAADAGAGHLEASSERARDQEEDLSIGAPLAAVVTQSDVDALTAVVTRELQDLENTVIACLVDLDDATIESWNSQAILVTQWLASRPGPLSGIAPGPTLVDYYDEGQAIEGVLRDNWYPRLKAEGCASVPAPPAPPPPVKLSTDNPALASGATAGVGLVETLAISAAVIVGALAVSDVARIFPRRRAA